MTRFKMNQSGKDSEIWAPVGAMAILLLLCGGEGYASTGTANWPRQASWTGDNVSSSRSRESGEITPFSPGSNNFALDLGQVFLMGELAKYTDSIGSQLHYTYGVSDLFGFDTSIGYSEHSEGKLSMATVLAGLRVNFSWFDKVVPYGIFGLGFYKPNYQNSSVSPPPPGGPAVDTGSTTAVLFGVHLGPGVDLALSKNIFFGAAITFHNMFGASKLLANGVPINVGGTYTSFFLHAGFTF